MPCIFFNFANKVNTFTFVDQTFYNAISDTNGYYNGIANFAFSTTPYAQYFTYVVLSTIEPNSPYAYFSNNNNTIDLSEYCSIESNLVPIDNDKNYYASVVACKLSSRRQLTHFGLRFTNTSDILVPSSLSISNIILDYIFLGVFKLGIEGAAIATGVSFLFPSLAGVYCFIFSKKSLLKF